MLVDEPSIDLQHAALICIKVLLQQLQQAYERNKEIILYILFTLTSCFSHQTKIKSRHANTPKYNITQLLKDVYKEQAAEKCPLLITIKTLAVHPDFVEYDDMVGIVCDLDYSVYSDFCWWTAEGLVCNQKDFRKSLPNLAIPIAVHTHRNQTQEKKNALLEVLLNNLMKLCGDRNIEIAECALRSLETFISLNDATVKSAVKVRPKILYNIKPPKRFSKPLCVVQVSCYVSIKSTSLFSIQCTKTCNACMLCYTPSGSISIRSGSTVTPTATLSTSSASFSSSKRTLWTQRC